MSDQPTPRERIAEIVREIMDDAISDEDSLRLLPTEYADRVLAALASDPPESRELSCMICGRENPTWHAPNDLWNTVMRKDRLAADDYDFVCPTCFANLASERGVATHFVLSADPPEGSDVLTHDELVSQGAPAEPPPAATGYASKVFELLERWPASHRARAFYEMENRWCWYCGVEQADDDAHANCGAASERTVEHYVALQSRIDSIRMGQQDDQTALCQMETIARDAMDLLAATERSIEGKHSGYVPSLEGSAAEPMECDWCGRSDGTHEPLDSCDVHGNPAYDRAHRRGAPAETGERELAKMLREVAAEFARSRSPWESARAARIRDAANALERPAAVREPTGDTEAGV